MLSSRKKLLQDADLELRNIREALNVSNDNKNSDKLGDVDKWWTRGKWKGVIESGITGRKMIAKVINNNITEKEVEDRLEQVKKVEFESPMLWGNVTPHFIEKLPKEIKKKLQDKLDTIQKISPNVYKWYMKRVYPISLLTITGAYGLDHFQIADYCLQNRTMPPILTDREKQINLVVLHYLYQKDNSVGSRNAILTLLRILLHILFL